jgi:Na+-driven multidrug efflux pump
MLAMLAAGDREEVGAAVDRGVAIGFFLALPFAAVSLWRSLDVPELMALRPAVESRVGALEP